LDNLNNFFVFIFKNGLKEEAQFYRQQRVSNQNPNQWQQQQQNDEIYPKTPKYIGNDNQASAEANNILQLQQQHHIPHNQLHSLDRFAMPLPVKPIPPQNNNNNNDITEADLSIEEVEDEEEDAEEELKNNTTPVNKQHQHHHQQQKNEETSIIDLDELDEAQLKQLKQEEERHQNEYFTIDHLNRLYCQSQFLYKVRGKKLEEVTFRFESYKEDVSREMRAMKHRLYLAETEKATALASVESAQSLCNQYKEMSDNATKSIKQFEDQIEKLKKQNYLTEQKVEENEQIIDSLQLQLSEQQKLDTMERVQHQHEQIIQQINDKNDKELMVYREQINALQLDINEKSNTIKILNGQLEQAAKNAEQTSIDRIEAINRLTNNLNELQSKYDKDIKMIRNHNSTIDQTLQKDCLIKQLNERVSLLEGDNSRLQLSLSSLNPTIVNNETNNTDNPTSMATLQRELDRALNTLKQKRNEIQKLQDDLKDKDEKLMALTSATTHDNQAQIQELTNEKLELQNDLNEKNTRLDELLGIEEQYQQIQHDLESQIYNKQQYINECEELIRTLQKAEVNMASHTDQMQHYNQCLAECHSEISDLKLELTNRHHELQKVKQMYIEVCSEKNSLEETLREQLVKEYEEKLEKRLEISIGDAQAEKIRLCDQNKRELQVVLDDCKSLRSKLDTIESERDELKNELNLLKNEIELNDKKRDDELSTLKLELNSKNHDLNQIEVKYNDLNQIYEKQKEELLNRLESQTNQTEKYEMEIKALNNENIRNLNELKEQNETKLNEMKTSYEELNQKLTQTLEQNDKLTNQLNDLQNKMEQFNQTETNSDQLRINLQNENEKLKNEINSLKEKSEKIKQEIETKYRDDISIEKARFDNGFKKWQHERTDLITKKDEEMEKIISQLNKRFEDDYAKFMQTQVKTMEKALNEKSQEHAEEKEKIIELYDKKLQEYESNEHDLHRHINELKQKLKEDDKISSSNSKLARINNTRSIGTTINPSDFLVTTFEMSTQTLDPTSLITKNELVDAFTQMDGNYI
jgi:chromosome segregation ATPase